MLWKGTSGPGAPRTGTYSYVFSNWADGYWRTLQLGARAGEQYDLYAYIRGELDADTTQGRFLIRAKFMDNNGASLGYSDITAMYPGAISSWTRVGGRVTAPANSVSMQVQYLLYQSSGWVNIDDVEVTIVPPNAATEITKYYMFGGQRVAMRKNGVLTYLHGDHLGSTVLATNANGTYQSSDKYFAYGKDREPASNVPTDHKFTGQKEDASGLQYFNARFYDPMIGLFISPDTMVPDAGNVFDYNRFMYARGNAMKYNDPSGHIVTGDCMCGGNGEPLAEEEALMADENSAASDPSPNSSVNSSSSSFPTNSSISNTALQEASDMLSHAELEGTLSQGATGEAISDSLIEGMQTAEGAPMYENAGFDKAYKGADNIVRNTQTGNLVVVESKINTTGKLDLGISKNPVVGQQMSEGWVENIGTRMQNPSSSLYSTNNAQLGAEIRANPGSVERVVIVTNSTTGEVTVYQPSANGGWTPVQTYSLK